MKKSAILASAIALLLSGAAAAEATVYGIAKVEMTNNDLADNWTVSNPGSRLGFKGSEDLGNGMKAVFQYEMVYDLSDGGGIGGARNSYVGLNGDFGTVLMGRHDTPNKSAFYAAGNDHLGDTSADLNSTYGFREIRASNVAAYVSNNMDGLKFAVAIAPGEGTGTAPSAGNGITDGTSVGVMYKSGPLKVGVGIDSLGDTQATGSDFDIMNLGGSYNMDNITVGLQYQTTDLGSAATDETIIALSAKFAMGDNAVIASFGTTEVGTADRGGMTLGYMANLSKRTFAYVAYSDREGFTAATDDSKLGFGMQHKF